MEKMKRINIMTSCDDNLAKQLPVLLQSIADNVSEREVHFYLFHSRIEKQTITLLEKFCQYMQKIQFHEIVVPNAEAYVQLAKRGGGWCGEAYYSFCAHELLPEDVDRIMYLDAGDVILSGDITEYYDTDFEDRSLIATAICYKQYPDHNEAFEAEDMSDPDVLKWILRGIFNSGSYVMNLKKLRTDGYALGDYLFLSERLAEVLGSDEKIYWGDQGLLSAAFVGDIKFFGYPEIADMWYMPYNFCMWYFNRFDEKASYATPVIHYAGGAFKPWQVQYQTIVSAFQGVGLHNMDELKPGQREYYQMWYEYALKAGEFLERL